MDLRFVDRPDALDQVRQALASVSRFALDCEAAGFHRYSDRLCLVQLTTVERTWILDPLAVPLGDVLRAPLEDSAKEVVMHGADFDLRLLDRDLGIRPRRLFDTQVAASLLGIDGIGLSSVLERTLGVKLAKKYQRADWARRPLPRPMLEYAALDTHHLLELGDRLRTELEREGRLEWAREEFEELRRIRHEVSPEEDPAARLKAARDMDDREVHRLREALEWRDEIARERDRAPFRVAGDAVLAEVARANPDSIAALEGIRGVNRGLARAEGERLLARLRRVDRLPPDEVEGLPPREPGKGRPEPEVEDRMARLKVVRNRRAGALGIDRGTLLPNSILQALAEDPPASLEEMGRIPGARRWQLEAVGTELLEALGAAHAPTGG
jgi:ribonuclease D